ncbi:MAG: phosphoenolpyruvate carboxylase [Defluviitaleaceae bacterium]|nr:phosphoenolpyruvate carboxylase [Defluviitaleaceae bacterium]
MAQQDVTTELLHKDMALLGDMLSEILLTHGGESLVTTVEKIKDLSKKARLEMSAEAYAQLREEVAGLNGHVRQDVIRAFATYFHLINVAEQNHRMRRNRQYQLEDTKTAQPFSIENAVLNLKEAGYQAEDIRQALPHLSLELIMTAHPTEATKRQVLEIQKRLGIRLKSLDNPILTEKEIEFIKQNILNEVAILWQTNELHNKKPTVPDEVKSGLYYFDQTLFDVLPDVHRELAISLRKHFPGEVWKIPNFIRFGSWIGGDRDGNPFVTHEVTWKTLELQRELVLKKYLEAFDHLIDRYSYCTTRIKVSADLMQLIARKETKYLNEADRWPVETEMYRRALTFMRYRLTQVGVSEDGYKSTAELLKEVKIIRESLKLHLPSQDEFRRISRFIRQIELFGFHLASLEIRNHSGEHETAIAEILGKINITKDYANLPESEKIDVLNHALVDPRPMLLLGESYSEATREVIATFKTIKRAHDEFGPVATPIYLISMTQAPSDLLEVLVLAKEVGLYYLHPNGQITSTLNISPLLETIDDLTAGQDIMRQLFEMPIYRHHLSLLGNKQEVMLGYSDGNKDGGTLAANWKLYQAQIEINALASQYGIHIKFFHGRGGSLGRGGSPLNKSILSQPTQTVTSGIKITEQGEVLASRYLLADIAMRSLEQAASTLLQTVTSSLKISCTDHPVYQEQYWLDTLNDIAEASFQKYRSLIFEDGDIFNYYSEVSPLNEIGALNIGSRPMRRQNKPSFEGLRAIPWVFGWMQNRQLLPGWYAAGTGLHTFAEKDPRNLNMMQVLYKEWPFFTAIIDNLHMALMKADMKTAEAYLPLATDQPAASRIFDLIKTEFEKTKEMVLNISQTSELLEHYPRIKDSIHYRNPYVDPLNYLQVDLLEKLRVADELDETLQKELLTQTLLTISGIAAGLRNTG